MTPYSKSSVECNTGLACQQVLRLGWHMTTLWTTFKSNKRYEMKFELSCSLQYILLILKTYENFMFVQLN